MSTIVYRDGIMAGDGRAYTGNSAEIGSKAKIRRLSTGVLVGVSSQGPGTGERLFAWLEQHLAKSDSFAAIDWEETSSLQNLGKFTMLAVVSDHVAYLFEDNLFPSGPIKAPYYAIGSGREYALGAMVIGCCAVDALRAACKLDVWSDFPITATKHDGFTWEPKA